MNTPWVVPSLLGLLTLLVVAVSGSPVSRELPAARPRARGRIAPPGPLDVARLVERLATVVASGVPPRAAWAAVAAASPRGPLRDLAASVGRGADPRRVAALPRGLCGDVSALGTALAVCERTGAPLGPVLGTLAEALRDVADAESARRSAFAGPMATARILVALPLAGMGLGLLLGADPVGFLLHGRGRLLAAAGIALTAVGWWWMHRLLRTARGTLRGGVDPSIVLDLIAGPLAAGAPLAHALRGVAEALGSDPLGPSLARAGRSLGAGVPARRALADLPAQMAPIRDAALVGEATGADLVGLLRSSGRDARRSRARDAEAAAARLAVRLVLPTGVALLPAFVLLGIIPTVASLLGGSFGTVLG